MNDLDGPALSAEARDLYRVISRRRDVRAEFTGETVDDATLRRVLAAGHAAPSVGNTMPWDFIVVRDRDRLDGFAEHVARCRADFADSLPPERQDTFRTIRVEGIRESGTGIVVTYDPTRGGRHVLGRRTVDDTGSFSSVLAIQNMWLAATAEGLGMGWVSFYEEEFLADFIGASAPVRPMAWLCLGQVHELQEVPDLVRRGWRGNRPLEDAVHGEALGGELEWGAPGR